MRQSIILPLALVLSAIGLAGCAVVAGIFRAGVVVGLLVVAMVVLIIWIISALLR